MTPLQFHETLIMLSTRFRFKVTSYFRDPVSNTLVGGHENSRHMLWLAADVVPIHKEDWQPLEVEAKRQGLGVANEGDHIHLQAQ